MNGVIIYHYYCCCYFPKTVLTTCSFLIKGLIGNKESFEAFLKHFWPWSTRMYTFSATLLEVVKERIQCTRIYNQHDRFQSEKIFPITGQVSTRFTLGMRK